MRRRSLALLLILGCSEAPPPSTIEVESPSPAIEGGELRELVGVAVGGGEFVPVLEPPCPLPCEVTASFSTAEDDQQEILIELYRGTTPDAESAHYLGTFEAFGLPATSAGEPHVVVTFRADEKGLSLSAEEASGMHVELGRAGP